MACGQEEKSESENTEPEDDDIPFDTRSTKSDFLSVCGSTVYTAHSDFLSVCGGSSTMRSDRTLSHLSTTGTETAYSSLFDDSECGSDDASTDVYDELMQLVEDVSNNAKTLCFNCISDDLQINATHFCHSCKPDGRFICHKCLQSHNKWCSDHNVVSLSVSDESSLDGAAEVPVDLNATKLKTTPQEVSDIDKLTNDLQDKAYTSSPDSDMETFQNAEQIRSLGIYAKRGTIENHPKMGIFNCLRTLDDRFVPQERVRPRFYEDDLLREITKDPRYTNPSLMSTGNLRKYGTYFVGTQSDTKCSIITGICELESGQLVLTDSENCKLKILNAENFQTIVSHNVDGHPSLICSIEGEKVAVAFADSVITVVLIAKDLQITNSFHVEGNCTSLTYGNGNLYFCLADRIESYSETGEKKDYIRLASNDSKTKFVKLHKIAISKDGDTLYITEKVNGIVVADTSGQVLRIISENIDDPNVLCVDGTGSLFVTEVNSDRVLKINAEDGKVLQELKDVSGIEHPISMCHARKSNRLIVGTWCSDNIHVFTCI